MKNTKTLTRVALLVAIELVMKMVGLGSVPVGPLYMSFLTLPIAVGAITMGPAVGALLGGVFGAVSFYDAITGASAMTGALFQVSPVNTFILCVGMRVLMGLCCGLIFSGLKRFDKPGTWSYIVSAMSAPFLNTVFFMGWIVLAFYGCDYVQNLVSVKGAANPWWTQCCVRAAHSAIIRSWLSASWTAAISSVSVALPFWPRTAPAPTRVSRSILSILRAMPTLAARWSAC